MYGLLADSRQMPCNLFVRERLGCLRDAWVAAQSAVKELGRGSTQAPKLHGPFGGMQLDKYSWPHTPTLS